MTRVVALLLAALLLGQGLAEAQIIVPGGSGGSGGTTTLPLEGPGAEDAILKADDVDVSILLSATDKTLLGVDANANPYLQGYDGDGVARGRIGFGSEGNILLRGPIASSATIGPLTFEDGTAQGFANVGGAVVTSPTITGSYAFQMADGEYGGGYGLSGPTTIAFKFKIAGNPSVPVFLFDLEGSLYAALFIRADGTLGWANEDDDANPTYFNTGASTVLLGQTNTVVATFDPSSGLSVTLNGVSQWTPAQDYSEIGSYSLYFGPWDMVGGQPITYDDITITYAINGLVLGDETDEQFQILVADDRLQIIPPSGSGYGLLLSTNKRTGTGDLVAADFFTAVAGDAHATIDYGVIGVRSDMAAFDTSVANNLISYRTRSSVSTGATVNQVFSLLLSDVFRNDGSVGNMYGIHYRPINAAGATVVHDMFDLVVTGQNAGAVGQDYDGIYQLTDNQSTGTVGYSLRSQLLSSTNEGVVTADHTGSDVSVQDVGAASVGGNIVALYAHSFLNSSVNHAGEFSAIKAYLDYRGSGSLGTARGIHVRSPNMNATPTTLVGLDINDQSGATTNYAIRTAAGRVLLKDAATRTSDPGVCGELYNAAGAVMVSTTGC